MISMYCLCFSGHGLDPWWRIHHGLCINIWWFCFGCIPGCGCGADPIPFGTAGVLQVRLNHYWTTHKWNQLFCSRHWQAFGTTPLIIIFSYNTKIDKDNRQLNIYVHSFLQTLMTSHLLRHMLPHVHFDLRCLVRWPQMKWAMEDQVIKGLVVVWRLKRCCGKIEVVQLPQMWSEVNHITLLPARVLWGGWRDSEAMLRWCCGEVEGRLRGSCEGSLKKDWKTLKLRFSVEIMLSTG